MRKILITMLVLFIGSMTMQAQINKAEKTGNIRAAYTKAKELIELKTRRLLHVFNALMNPSSAIITDLKRKD